MADETTTTTTTDDGATTDDGTTTTDGPPVKGAADQIDWQAASRKHEREAKKLRTELEAARTATQTAEEKALDAARLEGDKAARTEVGTELAAARLELAVLRSVGSKFADPADALRFIDPADVTGDDGTVDEKALTKKVNDLLTTKPYLAAAGGQAPQVPTGTRTGAGVGVDMNAALRQAAGRA